MSYDSTMVISGTTKPFFGVPAMNHSAHPALTAAQLFHYERRASQLRARAFLDAMGALASGIRALSRYIGTRLRPRPA
jgi:hypothetical protein